MNPIRIVLLGEPVGMAHRQTSDGGRRYVAPKARFASDTLRKVAQQEMLSSKQPMFNVPVKLELACEVFIPVSWSNRKRMAAIRHEVLPGIRPDLTNILKLAEDAFKQVVWRDDSLVVEQHCRKYYGVAPKIVITVSEALPQKELFGT